MRLGHVIGTVTLHTADDALKGGTLLVVQPMSREQFRGAPMLPLPKANSLVVFDNLGAGLGQIVGFTEGAEATMPFTHPIPIDALNVALIDTLSYNPPAA
ncbi:MAG: EutN/CcmL family microcompartment protein [Opitutaceae bacterium]|jgi:ethanolamine utilization protein EutN